MSDKNDQDLKKTRALFDFLQGRTAAGCKIPQGHVPNLTADQAWTVIWYLGNQYWQVTDRVERCDVCGSLYHTSRSGHCLDFGNAPYSFCDGCMESDKFQRKQRSRSNPEREQP